MPRIALRRIEKCFEAHRYTLVIYYHKDMSIRDIYNKVIKKEKRLKNFPIETDDRDESAVITHDDGISYLILNSKVPIGTLLHEIIHITTAMFDFIGAEHQEGNDELYAYQCQHIFEFILLWILLDKLEVPTKNLLIFN